MLTKQRHNPLTELRFYGAAPETRWPDDEAFRKEPDPFRGTNLFKGLT